MRSVLCLYVPALQRQEIKHLKNFSEQPKRMKNHKKNKESVLENLHTIQKIYKTPAKSLNRGYMMNA